MTTEQQQPTRDDVHALAQAFVDRMCWPSMHWDTQRLDFDAAAALARVALEHAPTILAVARVQQEAIRAAVNPEVAP